MVPPFSYLDLFCPTVSVPLHYSDRIGEILLRLGTHPHGPLSASDGDNYERCGDDNTADDLRFD